MLTGTISASAGRDAGTAAVSPEGVLAGAGEGMGDTRGPSATGAGGEGGVTGVATGAEETGGV